MKKANTKTRNTTFEIPVHHHSQTVYKIIESAVNHYYTRYQNVKRQVYTLVNMGDPRIHKYYF